MFGQALPQWARQLMPYLALGHGLFNLLVFSLLIRQGWLGSIIRRTRRNGTPYPIAAIQKHRRTGPLVAILGGIGFLAGIFLVLIDKGRLVEYPLHFTVGGIIVLVLYALYALSLRITTGGSPYRTPHASLGILLLIFYLVQTFLGLGILL